jgi:spore coat protein CotH
MSNVGFRVKGATSRLLNKKGWYIKFNEFNESGRSWYQMKKLGFKAGSRNDDTLLKSMLYTDFSRALGVAVQRASYSLLYINDIYAGVYFMHEDINPDFMTRRFDGDNGSGNNMKLFYDVNLQYYGSDLSYYKTVNYTNQLKVPLFWYEQSDGDGNWTDFIDWLQFINLSSDATFAKEIEQRVGVTLLLRQMMVESFMLASDNLASGANYYTYHRTSAPTAQWEVIEFDFDECFDFNDGKNQNIFQFFSDKSTSELNPMVNRILNIPSFNETFKVEYSEFLGAVFGSTSQQQPTFRYSGYLQFILPWVVKDKLWQVALGMTPSDFILDAENSISHLDLRYQEVAMQLN